MVGQDPSLAVTFNHCATFLSTSNTRVKALKHWICNLICFARSLGANPLGFNGRGLKDCIKKSVRSGKVCPCQDDLDEFLKDDSRTSK